jgi:GR25 family glycosyltransferase involved in LPS biosynthesis
LFHRWPLSKGEIACTKSHVEAIRSGIAVAPFVCILEDDTQLNAVLRDFLDPDWLASLPLFDILKLAGDRINSADMLAVPIEKRSGWQICVPLHPGYGAGAYIVSRAGAERILKRSKFVKDSLDVQFFRRPDPFMRFLDVRPFPIQINNEFPSFLAAQRWANVPVSRMRAKASWLPHRLILWDRRIRRLVAFVNAQGISGFARLRTIPTENAIYTTDSGF